MSVIYKRQNFIIVCCGSKNNRYYTVVNNNKALRGQHTHLDTFNEAKYVLFQAIKNRIPNDCSHYLQESIRRLIEKDYHTEVCIEEHDTIYAERYKTFCRKLNKKKRYYDSKSIKIVFLKLNPYGNKGYKAKVIKISNNIEYKNKALWKETQNGFWI